MSAALPLRLAHLERVRLSVCAGVDGRPAHPPHGASHAYMAAKVEQGKGRSGTGHPPGTPGPYENPLRNAPSQSYSSPTQLPARGADPRPIACAIIGFLFGVPQAAGVCWGLPPTPRHPPPPLRAPG